MNYKILSHCYFNAGGNTMMSAFDVWLQDENRTVTVYVDDVCISMHTVDCVRHDFAPCYYDTTLVTKASYRSLLDVSCRYFDLLRDCLFEYFKSDYKHYGCRQGIPFGWLKSEHQLQITAAQREYVDSELGGLFETDGTDVYFEAESGEEVKIPDKIEHRALDKVLASCLSFLKDRYHDDHDYLKDVEPDRLQELLITISDVDYYLTKE